MNISRATFVAFVLAQAACSAGAQTYPARAIQVISPVQAGSAGDTSLRILTSRLSENLGQQVIVENHPGAAGMIGMDRLIRATPDGHTLGGVSDSTLTYVPILQKRASFDALAVLEPISIVALSTWVLIVHPSLPVRTTQELVALAKKNPGRIDYASAGNGGSHHVVMEMFKADAGVQLTHIPYKGATQAALDVQAGRVPVMFSALAPVLPAIQSGKVKALGVGTEARSKLLPNVPTISESALPGFGFSTWTGLFAPKGTPRNALERLNGEVAKALNDPVIRERYAAVGATARPSSPAELADLTRRTREKMATVIRRAGITGE
jgi:tripartite-type tricarboxylate transporter receptor subunit TctC